MEPYRAPDGTPLFVCIVCFQQLNTSGGTCPRCASPLLPLDDLEVVDELRKRAKKIMSRLERTQMALIGGGAGVLSTAFFGVLLVTGAYDIDIHSHYGGFRGMGEWWPWVVSFSVLVVFLAWAHPRVFKRASMAMRFDPDEASVPSLLSWLGLSAPSEQEPGSSIKTVL